MVSRGRIPEIERRKAISRIIHALERNPEGLGLRELRIKSGIGSFETLYKYLRRLEDNKQVTYSEENVGRGKPKKTYKLTEKGIAYWLEFRLMEYFEKVRESCKKTERFEIDNYAFSYGIYGMPKNLNDNEEEKVTSILRQINSALIELDELRHQIINKEAYKYLRLVSRIQGEILQSFSEGEKTRKTIVIDNELRKEIWSSIPSFVREKMRITKEEEFAIVATRGPSFIDEFSLRPENHLLWLIESVERWDDEGIEFVIEQLARNEYVHQEAIDRMKKWDIPEGKISKCYWQRIMERLDDIPQIREEMQRKKEQLMQSGNLKSLLGIDEKNSIVVTKDMLGKQKLEEIKRELAKLK